MHPGAFLPSLSETLSCSDFFVIENWNGSGEGLQEDKKGSLIYYFLCFSPNLDFFSFEFVTLASENFLAQIHATFQYMQ